MKDNAFQPGDTNYPSSENSPPENSLCRVMLRNSIWLLGVLTWLFGVFDRGYATFTDGTVTFAHIAQLLTTALLFGSWLYLKPEGGARDGQDVALQNYTTSLAWRQMNHIGKIQDRMRELQKHHLVGREYVLPFPYLCQIYHLLNLKHLETIHGFRLNNLKVLAVNDFQPTEIGGRLRFQTILDSPFNVLRLWRRSAVEVELTLHTPFTVELQVPVRDGKTINVIFNVLPLNQDKHRFFVDIYSNLPWPKSLLRFSLEFAASLTLLEDLPYLRKLTARKQNLLRSNNNSDRDQDPNGMMQLYHRYINLYSLTPGLDSERNAPPESSFRQSADFPVEPV